VRPTKRHRAEAEAKNWRALRGKGKERKIKRNLSQKRKERERGQRDGSQRRSQLAKLADGGKGLYAILRGCPLRRRASLDVATGMGGRRGLASPPVAVAHV
jgi:hypothetical protein